MSLTQITLRSTKTTKDMAAELTQRLPPSDAPIIWCGRRPL